MGLGQTITYATPLCSATSGTGDLITFTYPVTYGVYPVYVWVCVGAREQFFLSLLVVVVIIIFGGGIGVGVFVGADVSVGVGVGVGVGVRVGIGDGIGVGVGVNVVARTWTATREF